MLRVPNDIMRMKFIPFALKDYAKRWMYIVLGLDPLNLGILLLISSSRARNEIHSFVQLEHKPFWSYINRFKELTTQCPHHSLQKWNLCQIIYKGFDVTGRIIVESMCGGEFLCKNADEA